MEFNKSNVRERMRKRYPFLASHAPRERYTVLTLNRFVQTHPSLDANVPYK